MSKYGGIQPKKQQATSKITIEYDAEGVPYIGDFTLDFVTDARHFNIDEDSCTVRRTGQFILSEVERLLEAALETVNTELRAAYMRDVPRRTAETRAATLRDDARRQWKQLSDGVGSRHGVKAGNPGQPAVQVFAEIANAAYIAASKLRRGERLTQECVAAEMPGQTNECGVAVNVLQAKLAKVKREIFFNDSRSAWTIVREKADDVVWRDTWRTAAQAATRRELRFVPV